MPTLHALRKELHPIYGHYADAAISLIGLKPHVNVRRSAKDGDLAGAHAVQIMNHRVDDPEREPFTGWHDDKRAVPVPSWFAKPVPPIPVNLPKLDSIMSFNQTGAETPTSGHIAFFGLLPEQKLLAEQRLLAGRVDFRFEQIGMDKAMVIQVVEQLTKGIKPRLSRKLEGWKNAAMSHLEELARQNDCNSMLFNTAEDHSRSNNTEHPIHVELLETYGRLPMQHGFKLRVLQGSRVSSSKSHAPRLTGLWWVKSIKKI